MDRLLLDRGWKVDVAVGVGAWAAGRRSWARTWRRTATPVSFADGILVVRADSTAWATQLRLMSSSILGRLEAEVGKDGVVRAEGARARRAELEPRLAPGPGPAGRATPTADRRRRSGRPGGTAVRRCRNGGTATRRVDRRGN